MNSRERFRVDVADRVGRQIQFGQPNQSDEHSLLDFRQPIPGQPQRFQIGDGVRHGNVLHVIPVQVQFDGVLGQSFGGHDRMQDVRTVGDPVEVVVEAFALYRTTHRPRAADVVGVDERAQQRGGQPNDRFTSRHGSAKEVKHISLSVRISRK